jgi:hypothetical protein
MDVLCVYMGRRNWSDIASAAGMSQIRGRSETIMCSYPMFPDNMSGDWSGGANGKYDAYHRSSAAALASYGRPFILRIGWEWNNRGRPWACLRVRDSGAYRTYFQRIVTALRTKLGSSWIDWSCDKGGHTDDDVRKWYPGNSYVDFLGPNQYDFWPAIKSSGDWSAAYNATIKGGPRGMGAWLNYAKSNGKKLSVGEWGLITGDPASGGDNPVFIQKVMEFYRSNAGSIAYECYFNKNNSRRHALASNPKGLAAYKAAM